MTIATDPLETDTDEFVCVSCDRTIYSFPSRIPKPTRCATCQWLDEFYHDPVEREIIRKRLVSN